MSDDILRSQISMPNCKKHGTYYPDFPGCPECRAETADAQVETLRAEVARREKDRTEKVVALVELENACREHKQRALAAEAQRDKLVEAWADIAEPLAKLNELYEKGEWPRTSKYWCLDILGRYRKHRQALSDTPASTGAAVIKAAVAETAGEDRAREAAPTDPNYREYLMNKSGFREARRAAVAVHTREEGNDKR